ncbi:MAG TPA: DNA repair protein RadC [Lachnospiraceae bacterium]|nr:DNA repair protein RadC [Lachnospiraceae bacterium]
MMTEKKYKLDQVAIRMVREKPLYSTEPVNTPEKAVKLLADAVRDYDREVVCVINFNSAMQPINMNICSMGAIDRAIVCPREVLKSSILSNASSCMLLHLHPSGDCHPSEQDVYITDRMQEVYKLMDIKLLDHIIIGGDSFYSFTENRIMPDKELSFTPIMELYQMKHGLEAQKEAVKSQVGESSIFDRIDSKKSQMKEKPTGKMEQKNIEHKTVQNRNNKQLAL